MKQMKILYDTPVMEIVEFEDDDVVTMSNKGSESDTATIDKITWGEGSW